AFLIDLSDDNYLTAFPTLLAELEAFSPDLAAKPRLVIGTKLDLEETEGRLAELTAALGAERVLGLSVFSGEGLEAIRDAFMAFVLDAEAAATKPAGDWSARGLGWAGAVPEGAAAEASDGNTREDEAEGYFGKGGGERR
ncbi:MAG TPA: GTPase ObgE, partial [Spirochaetales bacterium]|nr:GTPase ObgE [Spirochaetales bacterium]